METNVLFISGSGRSGTNITKAILGNHSAVATLPFEYRFTIDPNGIIDFYNTYPSCWSPFMASKKIKTFLGFLESLAERNSEKYAQSQEILKTYDKGLERTPFPYSGWELNTVFPDYQKHIQILESELVEHHHMFFSKPLTKEALTPPLSNFLQNCISGHLRMTNKQVFVEDNTWSILFADDLQVLVPASKMLNIVRDPRDVIASMLTQRWTPNSLKEVTTYYTALMMKWFDVKTNLSKSFYEEIRLEDLVEHKASTINQICEFTGIEFEESMMEVDLSKANMGRYRDAFNTKEIEWLNIELAEIIEHYRYSQ